MRSAGGEEGAPPLLAVVVFSKDRPYQLISCLGSLARSLTGAALDVSVLFKASSQAFADSYALARALFAVPAVPAAGSAADAASGAAGLTVRWEEETEGRPLGALLDAALERAEALEARGLLFTVDDALWFAQLDAAAALRALAADPGAYAAHLKLCPRVEFAHPNGKFMRVPRFAAAAGSSCLCGEAHAAGEGGDDARLHGEEPELLAYERSQGEYDWNYPWELSASIYRLVDVREMLKAIRTHFGEEGVNHPNHLEGHGVRLLKQGKVAGAAKEAPRCICSGRPAVAVVTVNRVQTLFDNPVYGSDGGGLSSPEASPEALDCLLRAISLRAAEALRGPEAAAEAMAERTGLAEAWLRSYWEAAPPDEEPPAAPLGADVADGASASALVDRPPRALLPLEPYRAAYLDSVHVPLLAAPPAPPAALAAPGPAVSWLMPVFNAPAGWLREACASISAQVGMGPGSWELLLVDDCSDGRETLEALAELGRQPQVRVLRLESRGGIARALNSGWRECKGDFVARLDADDIARRDRLKLQLAFMEAHPSISVLGGGFRTFQKTEELAGLEGAGTARRYCMKCHPLLARWHMLFSCSLAHPTVTFRRSGLASQDGPYPEGEEAEDHCCWLGLPLSVQIANVADVVSYIRRHPGSRSASAAAAIRRSSYGAVRRFLAAHCGDAAGADELTDEDVALLWGATEPASAEQVQRASRALSAAEALFLRLAAAEGADLPPGFAEDFLGSRSAGLKEYVRSSCSKLRGAVTVQSLAAGDLSSGTEMMRHWLQGGDGGLKSLGALINAGFAGQAPSSG